LSGFRELPHYRLHPGFVDFLTRILIQTDGRAANLQNRILFQILAGYRKLPHYRIQPRILHFLTKKEHFLTGSFTDPLLNLRGNHTDLD
jgi:hypothetical protein